MTYPIHGKAARIKDGATNIAGSTGWQADFNVDFDDVTPQGVHWRKRIAGCGDWKGKMDYILDPTNTEQKALIDNIVAAVPGTLIEDITFALDDGDYFSGDIYINGFSVPANIGGKVTGSFNFLGEGEPDLTV